MGLAVLLGFGLYLRLRELSGIKSRQLLAPQGFVSGHARAWSLNLHSFDFLTASKTGHYDETLLIDSDFLTSWISPYLQRLHTQQTNHENLWPWTHVQFLAAWKEEIKNLKLEGLNAVVYALRHGGASHDALTQFRSPLAIKERGRWADDRSLRRYKKSALLVGEVEKVPLAARLVAETLMKEPKKMFADPAWLRKTLRPIRKH